MAADSSTSNASVREPTNRLPFNLYDIFGYIIPGAYLLLMIYLVSEKSGGRLYRMIIESQAVILNGEQIVSKILGFSLVLVFTYMLGHVVATVSHVVFDRFLVGGVLLYPTEKVLRYNKESEFKHPYLRSTALYVCTISFLLLGYPALLFLLDSAIPPGSAGHPHLQLPICRPVWYKGAAYVLAGIVILRLLLHLISNIVSYPAMYRALVHRWSKGFITAYSFIPRHFITPAIALYESMIGTNRYFSKEPIQKFEAQFQKDFGMNPKEARTEAYWLPLIGLTINGSAMERPLTNWLQLYAFNRNMAAAAFVSIAYCVWKMHAMTTGDVVFITGLYTVNFFVMVAFITRYWMLYVTYYTKSIIRTYYIQRLMSS